MRICFSVFLAIIFLCGCNRNSVDTSHVFRYNESAGIQTLDPAFAKDQALIWACSQLYNGLVQLDSRLQIRPCIASRWAISPDGCTYTFHLRSDVYFHENPCFTEGKRKVLARDFVYSFERILSPEVASPGRWVFSDVDSVDGRPSFFAPNDSTFVIVLKHAFAPFLGILTMPYCSVVPKEAVAYYGINFRKNPVGTGAFYQKRWKENVKLILRRNPHYFECDTLGCPLPYLDGVAITFIADKQSSFLEFIKGNLDFISGIDPNYKDELLTHKGELQPKYRQRIQLLTEPYLNTEYLGFLLDQPNGENGVNPLSHRAVRQAINYGFDRQKMIKYLRNGIGKAGENGIIPEGLGGYCENSHIGYHYSPEKAKELLRKAGFPNGKGLSTITLSTTASYLDLCKYIQQQLSLLGLRVKVDVNPPAALREMIAQSKTTWFRGSWIADYPDAENYLSLFYSPNFCPNGPNYTHFRHKNFDILYERSRKETNDSLRYQMYAQMDSLIMSESPIVVLYYDYVLRFVQQNIENLSCNPMNMLVLKNVKKHHLDDRTSL